MKRAMTISVASGLLIAAGIFAVVGSNTASAITVHAIARLPDGGAVNVLCKYGTPHCVNPSPGPKAPKVGYKKIPDSGWDDPDCKYYGNCGFGSADCWERSSKGWVWLCGY
jgi:hypothetical protein